jgi:hypothetical protein
VYLFVIQLYLLYTCEKNETTIGKKIMFKLDLGREVPPPQPSGPPALPPGRTLTTVQNVPLYLAAQYAHFQETAQVTEAFIRINGATYTLGVSGKGLGDRNNFLVFEKYRSPRAGKPTFELKLHLNAPDADVAQVWGRVAEIGAQRGIEQMKVMQRREQDPIQGPKIITCFIDQAMLDEDIIQLIEALNTALHDVPHAELTPYDARIILPDRTICPHISMRGCDQRRDQHFYFAHINRPTLKRCYLPNNIPDDEDWYPIHRVAESGDAESLNIMLTRTVRLPGQRTTLELIDAQNPKGETALHLAAHKSNPGHVECAKLLIAHKAALGLPDNNEFTAMDHLANNPNNEMKEIYKEQMEKKKQFHLQRTSALRRRDAQFQRLQADSTLNKKPEAPSLTFGGAATPSSSNKPAPVPNFHVQPVAKPPASEPADTLMPPFAQPKGQS